MGGHKSSNHCKGYKIDVKDTDEKKKSHSVMAHTIINRNDVWSHNEGIKDPKEKVTLLYLLRTFH